MEKLSQAQEKFIPGPTYRQVYGEIKPDFGLLQADLSAQLDEIQPKNAGWVEDQLKRLRIERSEPLLDVLIVDEVGDVLNSLSTYRAYSNNGHMGLTMLDFANTSRLRERFVYPLIGPADTTLFWHTDNDKAVLPLLKGNVDNIMEEDYRGPNGEDSQVKLCRVKGGRVGKGKFADEGLIYGRLGFWVNNQLGLGRHGAGRFIERVRFDKSRLLAKTTYISPLVPEEVIMHGGKLMDSKYPNVNVARVATKDFADDFIVTSLHVALQGSVVGRSPTILGYTISRPWLGDVLVHGAKS